MSASRNRKYPEYKDSGRQWLKEIPSHWSTPKFGQVFRERRTKVSDKDFEALSVTKEGIVPQLATAAKTDHGDNRKLVLKDDFVINSRSDRKGSSGVSQLDGSVSTISIVLEILKGNSRYIHHLLRSHDFKEEFYRLGHGIVADLWSTRFDDIRGELLCFPPENEQEQIAGFLDFSDKAIVDLLKSLENLHDILEEQRSTLITKAVTKGLNPDVPMKNSGMETLGQLPLTWKLKQIKHIIQPKGIVRGPFGSSLKTSFFVKEGYKVYQQQNAIYQNISRGKAYIDDQKFSELSRFSIRENDFLMSCSGTIGRTYLVPENFEPGVINQALMIIRYKREYFDYEFLSWLMNSSWFQTQILDNSQGGAMKNIVGIEIFKGIKIPIPPIEQQIEISSFLIENVRKIEQTQIQIKAKIEKIKQYRISLISAAVTGKIDIRSL